MISKRDEELLKEAVIDKELSDGGFRQVVYSILNPATLSEKDILWAKEQINKIKRA